MPPVAAQADPATDWEAAVLRQSLDALVQRLPVRLRSVIVARSGLGEAAPTSFAAIGAALGVSGERARPLHTAALVWLRHPAHSQAWRSLLDRHTLADYAQADALAQAWLTRRGGRPGH